jgi:hypothetical protein
MSNKHREIILETMETVLELQLRGVRQALGKEDCKDVTLRSKTRKRKSLVVICGEILTERKIAVHVDELVEILREEYGRITDRDSLSSALAKKAKRGLLVRRISPATFEALELE